MCLPFYLEFDEGTPNSILYSTFVGMLSPGQTIATYRNIVGRRMLRPTMLRYVALTCCDRLAGALVSQSGAEVLVSGYFQVFQHKEKISDISSQASNEATLEQMLQKVN